MRQISFMAFKNATQTRTLWLKLTHLPIRCRFYVLNKTIEAFGGRI